MNNINFIEEKAIKDFSEFYGKIVEARIVSGYIGSDSVDIVCEPPAKLKIISTPKNDLIHWNGDWLDPYWNVEIEGHHPALSQASSLWINPIRCYNINGEIDTTKEWVLSATTLPSS